VNLIKAKLYNPLNYGSLEVQKRFTIGLNKNYEPFMTKGSKSFSQCYDLNKEEEENIKIKGLNIKYI
jgi:hypothetical protein